MIQADKNLLRATMTAGMLSLQQELIQLYCQNLNAIAVSGSLLAGFAYTGIAEIEYNTNGFTSIVIQYLYFFFVTATITTGFFMVCQSTIVTVFAPTRALKGESSEVVLNVVRNIQSQQTLIFQVAIVMITCLFGHCITNIWAHSDRIAVCIPITLMYIIGYIVIAYETKRFYDNFHPLQKDTYDARPGTDKKILHEINTSYYKGEEFVIPLHIYIYLY